MRTFGYLIIDSRSGTPVVKMAEKAIEAHTAKAVHDMMHQILDEWQQAQGTEFSHVCHIDPETDLFAVDLFAEEGGPVMVRIEGHRIEVYEDNDPSSLLGSLLMSVLSGKGDVEAHMVNPSNIADLPEELKHVLSAAALDPDCPPPLKAMLEEAGLTSEGAPKGVTKH